MSTRLILKDRDAASIRRHAAASYPEECCGILIGRERRRGQVQVERLIAAANAAPGERRRRYAIAPEKLLAAHRGARQAAQEVVGYYHSHPDRPARPSATDRDRAWPGVSYLIVSVTGGRPAEIRSWRLAPASPVSGGGGAARRELYFREEPWETGEDGPA